MLQSLAITALLAFPTTLVHAHGAMGVPTPVFADIFNKNAPSASLPGTPGPYSGSAEIKSLLESAGGATCGQTDANAAVQPVPADGVVVFAITAQHIGPCEIWLDNQKVVSATDCWTQFPDKKIPVDFSQCGSGASCALRWIWMATHTTPWEFYDNCVRVDTGRPTSGGGSGMPANATLPAPLPAPATVAPPSEDDATGTCVRGRGGDTSLDAWCTTNCAAGFCPPSHCEACE